VKTLLAVALAASPSPEADSTPNDRMANAQHILSELGEKAHESCEGIFARLAAPGLPLSDLRKVKELSKRLLAVAESQAHRDAATLLYHLAVATALVHRGEHISGEPLEARKHIYSRLAELFSGDAIGEIFRRASQ